MVNEFRALGLHQKVKDIFKRNMTVREVQELMNWHCDIRADNEMILAQLVTLRRIGKVT